ncbi:2-dehydro-3-deoxygalactonokinase [Microbulbifer sp. YPW1]|uniref:2-dehydro-3-deoxygalactonokinase n=1 Tax=Microbulbifer sp. YPW1 TaxID=2745199 RepID=UPI0015997A82|nr:2-dehydro-3-deoxygalactonokinase [Microbulbifer sp. YPW1]QKX17584.1 2-dehydro-3-deoxygalactonokinase [Microbulbifer sp. YPW1]
MGDILACDWGTSSFRLMRLDKQGNILTAKETKGGIKSLKHVEIERYLVDHCCEIAGREALPVVMCGMVGSGIGWHEVPYVDCPASEATLAAGMRQVPCDVLDAYCVPGVKLQSLVGAADVMRGEETQVVGWLSQASEGERAHSILCMPGTHSKWVTITDGGISAFSTAFTGELYALLTDHSVLVQGEQRDSAEAFSAGLRDSSDSASLIHQLFNARSRAVLGLQEPAHSAAYLSGLLLGSEVGAMAGAIGSDPVHLICGDYLAGPYRQAFEHYGVDCKHYSGGTFSAKGLWTIARVAKLV